MSIACTPTYEHKLEKLTTTRLPQLEQRHPVGGVSFKAESYSLAILLSSLLVWFNEDKGVSREFVWK